MQVSVKKWLCLPCYLPSFVPFCEPPIKIFPSMKTTVVIMRQLIICSPGLPPYIPPTPPHPLDCDPSLLLHYWMNCNQTWIKCLIHSCVREGEGWEGSQECQHGYQGGWVREGSWRVGGAGRAELVVKGPTTNPGIALPGRVCISFLSYRQGKLYSYFSGLFFLYFYDLLYVSYFIYFFFIILLVPFFL